MIVWQIFHLSCVYHFKNELIIIFMAGAMSLRLNRRQAFVWTNVGIVYWRIYATLSFNEWRHPKPVLSLYKYMSEIHRKQTTKDCMDLRLWRIPNTILAHLPVVARILRQFIAVGLAVMAIKVT